MGKSVGTIFATLALKTGKFTASLARARKSVNGFQSKAGKAMKAIKGVAAAAGIVVVTAAAFEAAKAIKEFDSATGNLRAVTGKTTEQLKGLIDQAKALGGSTKFTATEVAGLQTSLAKLGFTTEEVTNATKGILDLAAATGGDLAEAATVTGNIIRAFNLDASESGRVVDVMTASFQKSALDMDKFSTAMGVVAPVAKNAGVSLEQTTAILGKVVDAGVEASTAGTSLRNIFLTIAKKGITLDEALQQIRSSTNRNATALELFGKRGATVATVMALTSDKADELAVALENAGGTAARAADEQLNTLTGRFTILVSAWDGFILSLEDGSNVLGTLLKSAIDGVSGSLGKLTEFFSESASVGDKFKIAIRTILDLILMIIPGINLLTDKIFALTGVFDTHKDKADAIERAFAGMDKAQIRTRETAKKMIKMYMETGLTLDEAAAKYKKFAEILDQTPVQKNKKKIDAIKDAFRKLTAEQQRTNDAQDNFLEALRKLGVENPMKDYLALLKKVEKTTGNVVKKTRELSTIPEKMKPLTTGQVSGGASTALTQQVTDAGSPIISNASAPGLGLKIDAVSESLAGFGSIVGRVAQQFGDVITSQMQHFGDAFNALLSGDPIGAAAAVFKELAANSTVFNDFIKKLNTALGKLLEEVEPAFNAAIEGIDALIPAIVTVAKLMSVRMISALEGLVPIVVTLADILARLQEVILPIQQAGQQLLITILDLVVSILEPLMKILTPIIGVIADLFAVISSLINLVVELLDAGLDKLFEALAPVLEVIVGVLDKLLGALEKVIAKIDSIGIGKGKGKIPSFDTGGVMPQDGLAMVHAGETVMTPSQFRNATAPGNGRMSGQLTMEGDRLVAGIVVTNSNRGLVT